MNWATRPIQDLKEGRQTQCRPHGNSMRGRINSGQLVTLEPIVEDPSVGDAVLCRVRGNTYIHLVKGLKGHNQKKQFLIGNNRGGTNGWIGRNGLFGKVIKVEDQMLFTEHSEKEILEKKQEELSELRQLKEKD